MPHLSDVTRGRLIYGGDYHPEQWPEELDRVPDLLHTNGIGVVDLLSGEQVGGVTGLPRYGVRVLR